MKKHFLFFLICLIFFNQHFALLTSQESLQYDSDEWSESEKIRNTEIENNEMESIQVEGSKKEDKKRVYSKAYTEGIFNIAFSKLTGNKKNIKLNLLAFNSYLSSQYYEVFLSFRSTEKIEFSTYTGSVRFTPLLVRYSTSKLKPAISFYLGSFTVGQVHKNLYHPFINSVSPSSNRFFFPTFNALKISKKALSLGTAFECALPFFNLYFFWKKIDGKNGFNFYVSYKNERLRFLHSKLNIGFVASFLELTKDEKIRGINNTHEKNYKQGEYSRFFGIDLNFASQFFFINSSYFFNFLPKKVININSTSFRGEIGFLSKIVCLTSGVSYEGASYLGNASYGSLANKKNRVSFYLQGKLKYKFFNFALSYNLLKDYKTIKLGHSYGFFYSLDLYSTEKRKLIFKNELFFNNNIYKLKTTFILRPNLIFFSFFSLSSFLYLQEYSMNKNIVKNYEVDTKLIFPIAEHFKLHTLFGISQKNEKIKWKPLVFFVHTGISFFFIQENTKEIGSISLKYSSGKNVLDLQIKMRVEY